MGDFVKVAQTKDIQEYPTLNSTNQSWRKCPKLKMNSNPEIFSDYDLFSRRLSHLIQLSPKVHQFISSML
jgi:hypothetical protein